MVQVSAIGPLFDARGLSWLQVDSHCIAQDQVLQLSVLCRCEQHSRWKINLDALTVLVGVVQVQHQRTFVVESLGHDLKI